MFPIRKILVPVNFTEACRQAGKFGLDLAFGWKSDICFLHVLEPSSTALGLESGPVFRDMLLTQREEAGSQLQQFLNWDMRINPQRMLLEGDPAATITRFAHNEAFDLILMPTRGFGIFRRLLIGSVTAKVLHDADCLVWTGIHPEAATDDGIIPLERLRAQLTSGPKLVLPYIGRRRLRSSGMLRCA